MSKKPVLKKINKIDFPNLNLQMFYSGKSTSSLYIKMKSPISHSKYDIKTFLFDMYSKKIFKVHSKIERVKKNNGKTSKQKKCFWVTFK